MKHILTISSNDQGISWGPAVHYLELWNAFAQRFGDRYEIFGLVPSWTGLPCIKLPAFKIRQVKVPNVRMLRQVVFDLAAALRILASRKSLIYLRLSSFHVFVIAALAVTRRQFCLEMNGISSSDSESAGKPTWFKIMSFKQERSLIRKCALVFAVSKSIGDYALEAGACNVQVVRNSVNPDLFLISQKPAIGPRIKVLYVGTFTSWDGSERIPGVAREFPDIEFLMIGDGDRRKEIQNNAPANVTYLGSVPYSELAKHYAEADAGVVLYEKERHRKVGLSSLKVLEYMAAGLPIFSTDVPGQEFIADHNIGRLARGEDLAQEFSMFLSNLAQYKRNMEEYRHTIGKQHSWVHAAQLTEKAISSLPQ